MEGCSWAIACIVWERVFIEAGRKVNVRVLSDIWLCDLANKCEVKCDGAEMDVVRCVCVV